MKIAIPDADIPRVVIVGCGFGGLTLARNLVDKNVQVIIVDKQNYHTFQPLLYQVATAALEADSIAYPIRTIFEGNKNFYFRMTPVLEIIADENAIETQSGRIPYDYLVIATGSKTNFFNNEGLTISTMPLKTIPEALDLRSFIFQNFEKALVLTNERKRESLMTYVIAGGGPTGVELAGALGELKKNILPKDFPELDFSKMKLHLIEGGPRLLPSFSEKSSGLAKKYLEGLHVEVRLNTFVTDYSGDYVQTSTHEDIVARTLIWSAGVMGAHVPGLSPQAYHNSKRIFVDQYHRVKGYENIFAVGDVALMITNDTPKGHPMVAPSAIQQGENLSENILRIIQKKQPLPYKYRDKGSMATIGKNKAVAEIGKISAHGMIAWYMWAIVHLMQIIGFRNKFIVMFNWMRSYLSSDYGIRLIIRPFVRDKAKKMKKDEYEEQKNKQL